MKNNIAIGMLAHVDAGKTTLSEALLYKSGAIRKLGRVDNRDAFLDTNQMERTRGITIFSKQAVFELDNMSITLLDTPGHVDFSAEMERTLQVLDYAVLVISGADGVQSHTETLWRLLARYRIPTFVFVNKMDQPGTDRARLLEQLKNQLSDTIIDFSFPESIDLEELSLCDEALLEQFLENGKIDNSLISTAIAKRHLFPCFFGSALKLTGIDTLINGFNSYILFKKYPEKFGAKVFKIARDVSGNRLTYLKVTGGCLSTRMQITPEEKVNQIRIYSGEKYTTVNELQAGGICAVTGFDSSFAGQSIGSDTKSSVPMLEPVMTYQLILPDNIDALQVLPKLRMLEEEEPQLHIVWNELLGQINIQVMGAVQIEILQSIIQERFNIKTSFSSGSIVYKETITNTVEGVGHFEPLRHYAEVHLIIEPGEQGSGIQYKTDCSEDILDRNWQRLIMTHLSEKTHLGVLTGAPLTDVVITLVSGRAHPKHTEGGDFRQATYRAVRQGLMQADSVLLEPFFKFTLKIPSENIGRAMNDLDRMNAEFVLSESSDLQMSVLTGTVPAACLGSYQTEVMSYTKGLGRLSCQMDGYKPCHNTQEVIENSHYEPLRDTLNPTSSVFCSHGAGTVVEWDEVFSHMHLASVLEEKGKGVSDNQNHSLRARNMSSLERSRTVSDDPIGTDEIDAILRQTYYANSSRDNDFRKRNMSRKADSPKKYVYKGTETVQNQGNSYLLVDGYNIIFAWKELKELAAVNLDSARGRLLDILCNYQAMKKCSLIVVFDAYRVQGHDTETLDYHNIHVVFTKEAETADHYIEKFAHEHGRKDYVRVATSDGLEQVIIIGQGCHLVSAREFEQEVQDMEAHIRNEYLNKSF